MTILGGSRVSVIVGMLVLCASSGSSRAMDQAEALELASEYLASDDDADRLRLAGQLAEYEGDPQPLLTKLAAHSYEPVEAGYHPEDEKDESSQLDGVFDVSGMIAVGPSAPWNERSSYRWCLRESDDYWGLIYPIKIDVDLR